MEDYSRKGSETENTHELNISERRKQIMEMVNREGSVRVADLSRLFAISEVTIRNDLGELERMELLERTHGGATKTSRQYSRLTVLERLSTNKNEKIAIAKSAVSMINDGDTIFLNSGTTAIYIAQHIQGVKNLLALTNSPLVAQELCGAPDCEVVLVGGSFNAQLSFTYGDDTVRQISKYYANKFFFSCDGISAAAGIMTYNTHEVQVVKAFMEKSATTIAVADYSKIGRLSRISLDSVSCLDTIVTNSCADEGELNAVREMGVEIITV